MTMQFLHAILWNTINVFLYKVLLQTHQACLFYSISKELFGISGSIFSCIYLLISLTNFGFDYSLFSFYQRYSSSQTKFKWLIHQYFMRFFILSCIILGLWMAKDFLFQIKAIHFFISNIPQGLIPYLVIIFITESLKKSLETLAQLFFLNKSITILEISTIIMYLTIVWSSYFIRGSIDLYSIFIPMMLTSFIELTLLIRQLYHHVYKSLPPTEPTHLDSQSHLKPQASIIANQAVNYPNQIAKALFSPNFLILFLAYHLGMSRAGYIKLFTDIIILLYMLLNRSIGIPSGALLSRLSQSTLLDQQTIKATFLKITNAYIQLLYALAITLTAAITPCIFKSSCFNSVITNNILLFILAGFMEYIVITYEKLFITQNASKNLAFINLISIICLLTTLYQLSNILNNQLILVPIILIRLVTISIIAAIAYKKWTIIPSIRIHFKTLLAALSTSSLCLLIHYFI